VLSKPLLQPAQRKKTPEMSGHPQMKEEKSFHEVMEQLPNIVDDSTLREVSVPYCFVCLLHLANENHLQLDGTADLNDLIVKQTSSGSPQSSF
jgi:condensin complex subunit 2